MTGVTDRRILLPGLYATADVFVYSSETETLGLVLLEAMASGLPVIAAPVAGVAGNLRDGENGLGFAAGDAADMADRMERPFSDADLRRRLAAGARRWAESHSWDAELDRLDVSYREVIAGAVGSLR